MSALYRYIIVFAVILVIGAGALMFWFWSMELDRAYAQLADTRETLASTQNDLEMTQATLEDALSTLSQTTAALSEQQTLTATLEDEVAQLQQEGRQLRVDLTAVRARNSNLLADLNGTRNSLVNTRAELHTTQSTLTDTQSTLADTQETLGEQQDLNTRLQDENTDLQDANSTLQGEKEDLEDRLETVTGDYAELVDRAGTKEQLEEDAEELRREIRDLEDQREPLILDSGEVYRIGFRCTGSMEPVITCLDEATWLFDYRPEDIVVGATIYFSPSCSGSSGPIAHRVTDIEVRGGVYYYWPKGDSNLVDDGCWVPETDVRGYIVDIHRDVRPENADLRDHVNRTREAYYDLLDQHCGDVSAGQCSIPEPYYSETIAARDSWSCWADIARTHRYGDPIPLNFCG